MISAIILAAGESRRMGKQKLLMPWGEKTVLEHVISVFADAGVEDILVVIGSHRKEIERMIEGSNVPSVRTVFNAEFASGEMLASVQCGLRELENKDKDAALIGLGDQPQVRESTVRLVCDAFRDTGNPIIVPSFNMRRGHPWLLGRILWKGLTIMTPDNSPRDFLNSHQGIIHYVEIQDASILADLDTPEDYLKQSSHVSSKLSNK